MNKKCDDSVHSDILPKNEQSLDFVANLVIRDGQVCDTVVLPVEDFSANGQQCLNRLCQLRGQAQVAWSKLIRITLCVA